jgi:type VI secretion system secreted protein VgrG
MPHDRLPIESASLSSRVRRYVVAFGLMAGAPAALYGAEASAPAKPAPRKILAVPGDLVEIVAGSAARKVGANSSEDVGGSRSVVIGGDREVSIGGDDALTVGGSSSVVVSTDLDAAVGGNVGAEVGKDASLLIGGLLLVESADGIELRTGAASIVLKKSGEIVLRGTKISLQSSGDLRLKGSSVRTN